MKICDGKGRCYRRYKKYYFDEYEKVECSYGCVMTPCKECKFQAPQWYFEQYSSGLCYECNKIVYRDEAESDEDDLRSDATIDSILSDGELEEYNKKLREWNPPVLNIFKDLSSVVCDIYKNLKHDNNDNNGNKET